MGIARWLLLVVLVLPTRASGKDTAGFRSSVGDAEVDWSAGTITAQAGAAADLRMPGPNTARPGAERRARAAAERRLRAAVAELAPGRSFETTDLAKLAEVTRTEYQSDGGVVLWLRLRFADLVPAKGSPVALRVSTMPLELAPVVKVSGNETRLGYATYRPAAQCPRDAIRVQRDRSGRLTMSATAGGVDSLAGAIAVIYLEKSP